MAHRISGVSLKSEASNVSDLDSDEPEYDNNFEIDDENDGSGIGQGDECRETDDSSVSQPGLNSPPRNVVFYRCVKCNYQTKVQYLLDRHVAKHEFDRPFQCTSCDYSDYDHMTFVDHWVKHNQQRKIMKCPFCLFKCNTLRVLKYHVLQHRSVEMLDCSMCEFSSNYVDSMKNHNEAYHTKLYPCEHCSEEMTKYELNGHYKNVHGIPTPNETNEPNKSPAVGKSCSGQSAPRSKERSSFRELSDRRSSSQELPDRRTSSQELPDRSSSSRELPGYSETPRKYDCPFCAYSATTTPGLYSHIDRLHTIEFSCEFCSEVMTKYELIIHQKALHKVTPNQRHFRKVAISSVGGKKILRCRTCNFSSNTSVGLQRHEESFHKKKYPCKFCDLVMSRYVLIKHSKMKHGVIIGTRGRLSKKQTKASTAVTKSTGLQGADSATSQPVQPATSKPGPSTSKESNDLYEKEAGKIFVCYKCSYSAHTRKSFKAHMDHIHSANYKCQYCPVVGTKYSLMKHVKAEHDIAMTADSRQWQSFTKVQDVEIEKKTNSDGSCERQNTDYNENVEPTTAKADEGRKSEDIPEDSKENTFGCEICDFSSRFKDSVKNHTYTFHTQQLKCDRCPAIMTKYDLISHSKQEHGVEMKRRGRRPCLSNTQTTHLSSSETSSENMLQPFNCTECPYSSFFLNNVQQHVLKLHTIKSRCNVCSAEMTRYELLEHSREEHGTWSNLVKSGETAAAKQLGKLKTRIAAKKAFRRRIKRGINETQTTLRNQKVRSSGQSPAGCSTGVAAELEPNEKQCPQCEFNTLREDLFNRHAAKHEPVMCPVCNAAVANHGSSVVLPKHFAQHNPPETPWKCPYCGNVSKTPWNMFYHLSKHIEALKIFDCPECEYCAHRRDFLESHIRNAHKGGESPKKNKNPEQVGDGPGTWNLEVKPEKRQLLFTSGSSSSYSGASDDISLSSASMDIGPVAPASSYSGPSYDIISHYPWLSGTSLDTRAPMAPSYLPFAPSEFSSSKRAPASTDSLICVSQDYGVVSSTNPTLTSAPTSSESALNLSRKTSVIKRT